MIVICSLLALTGFFAPATRDEMIKSETPAYDLKLPAGYLQNNPPEKPPKYFRICGRDYWAKTTLTLIDSPIVLAQNLSGVTLEQIQPYLSLPPESKFTFKTLRWKDLDIGSVEFHAIVKELPVFGLAAVVPLRNGLVTISLFAPEPLEKDCREDFVEIVSRMSQAATNWHQPEYFEKVKLMDRVGMVGVGLLAAYPIAWFLFFRGNPMLAHWPRVAWMVAAAVLLFIPISSPGETTVLNNLLVNAMLPLFVMIFAVRRVKMGIEME